MYSSFSDVRSADARSGGGQDLLVGLQNVKNQQRATPLRPNGNGVMVRSSTPGIFNLAHQGPGARKNAHSVVGGADGQRPEASAQKTLRPHSSQQRNLMHGRNSESRIQEFHQAYSQQHNTGAKRRKTDQVQTHIQTLQEMQRNIVRPNVSNLSHSQSGAYQYTGRKSNQRPTSRKLNRNLQKSFNFHNNNSQPGSMHHIQKLRSSEQQPSISEFLLHNIQAQIHREEQLKMQEQIYARKLSKIRTILQRQKE